ncbi:MAG: hypothetical protein CMN32_04090 [Saprospirales bacterium]|nr:hypothetical protein [Saprospirales bacterium]
MNKLTTFLALLSLLTFTFGCANSGSENVAEENAEETAVDPAVASQDSLRDVVMEIHDAVMPKMGEINRLQRELRKWKEAHPDAEPATKEEILKTLDWLTKADEGMMDWMAGFSQPANLRDSLSHEAIMEYLAGEQKKVQVVYDDINGSIAAAKALLEKLNEENK